MTRPLRRRAVAALTAAGLCAFLAACGSDDGTDSADRTGTDAAGSPASAPALPGPAKAEGVTTYPLTLDNCGTVTTFPAAPKRVLVLNGTSVGEIESMIVLGLQDRVLANAQSYGVSDQPGMTEAIAKVAKGGLTMNKNFDVPAEQVLALKPDLVVSTWSGGFDPRQGFATREQLTRAGIPSLVNPVNCAFGKPDATAAEKAAHDKQSVASTSEFLTLLGQVFDVPARAKATVAQLQGRMDSVSSTLGGTAERPSTLIAYPGMSMMNSNGLPAVMSGGIYDDVLARAGTVNAFLGQSGLTRTLNREQLAAAKVDLLVVGRFTPDEKPEEEAKKLFAAYPQWAASKSRRWVAVSDGVYLGPTNAWAVEAIAKAANPDKF